MLRVVEQAYRTDTGRQRQANEDSFFAGAPLFAVADGMGGAQAGEVASRIAADSFEPAERGSEPAETYLRSIAEEANRRIHAIAQRDSTRSGMGTTLTAAMLEDDEVSIAHVGDSRAYLYRDGELRLLTSDHSLVEELRRQGRLTDAQAQDHPQRSIITRALGPEEEVEIDTLTVSARPGDVILLTSDGLTTMIKDERIAEILADDRVPRGRGRPPGPRGERGRRSRQHHRGRLPPGRGGGRRGGRGRDPRRPQRRRGRALRRAHPRRGRLARAPRGRSGSRTAAAQSLAHRRQGAGRSSRGRRDRRRRLAGDAPGLFPRHRRGRPADPLSRPAVRAPARDRPLLRGLLGAGSGCLPARGPARERHRSRAARP